MKIAIIPARGGSKRLPRKNILPINDTPIINYPIKSAIKSGLFDKIIVSTDDSQIISIVSDLGVDIVKRPSSISDDVSSVSDVCLHVLEMDVYRCCEYFCCIYPTALFVKENHLIESYSLLNKTAGIDYVMGVSSYNFPPVQALYEKNGFLSYMWPEFIGKKSQEHPKLNVSNGSIYWARTEKFCIDKTFYGEKLLGYEFFTVDIDTSHDFKIAECLFNNLN